ncbi:hypothetical protein [Candidatus Chloroploca sp. Khr17]|uniref:hypothetical protein n=1 Tax=Candidatus Chloroploca sp. Khr17 TaxID=2496869 RepID=UPI00101CF1F3|nr:hypothetical protein [Candidatus Chloroploca sp. Khr17]
MRLTQNANLQTERIVGKYSFYDYGRGFLHAIGCALSVVPVVQEFIFYQYILVCRPVANELRSSAEV